MEPSTTLKQEHQTVPQPNRVLAEVWGDVVDFKELLLSLAINAIGALGGYLIAPSVKPYPLLFGLAGAAVAFVISAVLFKPKRVLIKK